MRLWLVLAAASVALAPHAARAAVTVFAKDLAGFNSAAGNPPIVVDFDSVAFGTDIGGMTIAGITFTPSATGAALIVVEAADTMTPAGFSNVVDANTNVLPATSGAGALSPGRGVLGPGPNDAVENDDLVVTFASPVAAVGFDHLSQSADGFAFTNVTVYGAGNSVLFAGGVPISDLGGGGAPAGADFWGIVSDANDIARIEIDEGDGDATFPDCNIGYDTFRVGSLVGATTTTTSTTTTTLAGGCGSAITLAQLNCRLAALSARLAAVNVGKLAGKLSGQLRQAKAKKELAESQCAAGDTKRARKSLKKSERKLIGFSHTIHSLTGRRTITDATVRDALATTADGIKNDMKTLRSGVGCT